MTENIIGSKKVQYTILKKDKLGKGSYATVYKGFEIRTKNPVAIKAIGDVRFKRSQSKFNEVAQRELSIFNHTNNIPNVISLIDYAQYEASTYIIMEFCEGGTLRKLLRSQNERRFEEAQAVKILQDIARGVFGLHQKNIMHKDLNLENILIKDNHFVIADLGSAVRKKRSCNFAGAEGYSAPEVYLAHEGRSYNKQVDIWALGVMFFEMLYSRDVYKEIKQEIVEEEQRGKERFPNEPKISKEAKDLLNKMLTVNPKKRITIEGIVNHRLLRKSGMPAMIYREEELADDEDDEEEDSSDEIEITGELLAQRKLQQNDRKKQQKKLKKKLKKKNKSAMNEESKSQEEESNKIDEEYEEKKEDDSNDDNEEEIEEIIPNKVEQVKIFNNINKKASKKSKKKNKNKKQKSNLTSNHEENSNREANSDILSKTKLASVAIIVTLALIVLTIYNFL